MKNLLMGLLAGISLLLASCGSAPTPAVGGPLKVLAVETFLGDIAQNIAGDRLKVDVLLPPGADPHAYQPTPQDVTRLAESQVLIINGAGYESWLSKTLENAGSHGTILEASSGLTSRMRGAGEAPDPSQNGDPHFWMDPNNVITYARNIQAGLTAADPAGKDVYAQNTANYIARLHDLDAWIQAQVNQIPPAKRLLVTNHESIGYFADRYGFTIAGTIIPSTSSESSPSALQMAALIDTVRREGVRAIFLETGANPQLADQIAQETGTQVITDLYVESLSKPGGPAPDYISMLKYDVGLFTALK